MFSDVEPMFSTAELKFNTVEHTFNDAERNFLFIAEVFSSLYKYYFRNMLITNKF